MGNIKKSKTFIIIVNYHTDKEIISLLSVLKKEKVDIIIINNFSNSQLLDNNKNAFYKIIDNKKNLGFARAINCGIKIALRNYASNIILLNPDVKLDKGFIEKFIEADSDIASPIISYRKKNRIYYDLGGKINKLLGRAHHIESTKKYALKDIDFVSGCCMKINKEVFNKIGLFNEKYFLYWEDVDFCLRAKMAGFKIKVLDDLLIYHYLVEENTKSLFKIFNLIKGNCYFINKYIPIWRKWLSYIYLILLSIKMIFSKFLCLRR